MNTPAADNGPPREPSSGPGVAIIRVFLLGLGYLLVVPLLPLRVRILREYERGVMFRLGRIHGVMGPGLIVMLPIVDRMMKTDLRTVTIDIPPQGMITRDNVPVAVNAVLYFRVMDPALAVLRIEDYLVATSQIAQTTLRSVLGQSDLDELLGQREQINQRLQAIIDEATDPWGIKVSAVEIKDVGIPDAMQRAMAAQAEAERERRAKVIAADGEFQASERLRDAAGVMARESMTLQLRYLQTLQEIGVVNNRTVAFPLPTDLLSAARRRRNRPAS